jgi:hypothetical protein
MKKNIIIVILSLILIRAISLIPIKKDKIQYRTQTVYETKYRDRYDDAEYPV